MAKLIRAALAVALFSIPAAALAQSNSGYDLRSIGSTDTYRSYEYYYGVETGTTITVLVQDNAIENFETLEVQAFGDSCSGAGCVNKVFTSPTDGDVTVAAQWQSPEGEAGRFYLECRGAEGVAATTGCDFNGGSSVGGSGGDTGGTGGNGGDTSGQGTAAAAASRAAAAAGSSSASAISGAIGRALGTRQGGASASATQGRLFFASPVADGPTNVWGSVSASFFSGALEGDGVEFTLGIDHELNGGAVIGAVLSYGRYDLDSDRIDVETNALTFGPYIAAELSEAFEVQAYALYARPEYELAGSSYTSERIIAGVDIGANYELGSMDGTGYFSVSGFTEDLPNDAPGGSRRLEQMRASIGTRMEFGVIAGVRPNLTVGIDATRLRDGDDVIESVSSRLGAGFQADLKLGTLAFDVMSYEVFDDAQSVTANLSYRASF